MRISRLKNLIVIFLFSIFFVLCRESKASGSDSIPKTAYNENIIALPPLDTLIALAQAHSPLLGEGDALIEKNTADIKRVKKLLWDAVKLNTGIQYGNYYNPLVSALSTGYYVGGSLQFSLYQLFSYKNTVQVYSAEKKVSMHHQDQDAQDLAALVTQLYIYIQGQTALLKIRSEGSYSAFSHMKMAEKEFNEGSIEVSELSRVTEIYTKAQADYINCVTDLKNYYQHLEILIGIPLKSYKQ
jgi:outer membrane protein TolC